MIFRNNVGESNSQKICGGGVLANSREVVYVEELNRKLESFAPWAASNEIAETVKRAYSICILLFSQWYKIRLKKS